MNEKKPTKRTPRRNLAHPVAEQLDTKDSQVTQATEDKALPIENEINQSEALEAHAARIRGMQEQIKKLTTESAEKDARISILSQRALKPGKSVDLEDWGNRIDPSRTYFVVKGMKLNSVGVKVKAEGVYRSRNRDGVEVLFRDGRGLTHDRRTASDILGTLLSPRSIQQIDPPKSEKAMSGGWQDA